MDARATNKNKVVVIGLDGGTFDIIEPLVDQGKLPNIAKIMTNGVYGPLTSTIPPITPCAWSSFMTGKNPGKHGVFEFVGVAKQCGETKLVNASSIKSKTLWEILGDFGRRSIVVNVPVTYPPQRINGVLVSGMLTPRGRQFTYPPHVAEEILRKFEKYEFNVDLAPRVRRLGGSRSYQEFLEQVLSMEKRTLEVILYLMECYDYDFLMACFRAPDIVSHAFWHMSDTTTHTKFSKFRDTVAGAYEIVDELVGRLVDRLDRDTTLVIMSDHGFGSVEYKFYINEWLRCLELLKFKRSADDSKQYLTFEDVLSDTSRNDKWSRSMLRRLLFSFGLRKRKVKRWIDRFELGKNLRQFLPYKQIGRIFRDHSLMIDWNSTKAYLSSYDSQGIRINLKGREPNGVVEPGREYEELRQYLKEALLEIRNPYTNEKVVENAFFREEIYTGPYVDEAPDIMIQTNDYRTMCMHNNTDVESVFEQMRGGRGWHKLTGIFIAKGPPVKTSGRIDNVEIIDIAPTVLHLMGLPVPKDIDGRVLSHYLTDSFMESNAVRYKDINTDKRSVDEAFQTEDESEIKKRLRALGYLG